MNKMLFMFPLLLALTTQTYSMEKKATNIAKFAVAVGSPTSVDTYKLTPVKKHLPASTVQNFPLLTLPPAAQQTEKPTYGSLFYPWPGSAQVENLDQSPITTGGASYPCTRDNFFGFDNHKRS